MANILIRDVPDDDLEQIRSAAAAQGTSVQRLLLGAVQAQATHLRRRAAITAIEDRLQGQAPVPEEERAAVLDAIDAEQDARARQLSELHEQ